MYPSSFVFVRPYVSPSVCPQKEFLGFLKNYLSYLDATLYLFLKGDAKADVSEEVISRDQKFERAQVIYRNNVWYLLNLLILNKLNA